MNKRELCKAVSKKAEVSQLQTEKIMQCMLEVITENLARGESVKLVGFGSFYVKERASRSYREFSTGKVKNIPVSYTASFKSGCNLKNAVKEYEKLKCEGSSQDI